MMSILRSIVVILILVLLSETKYVASTIIKSIIEKQSVTISNINNDNSDNNNNNNVIIKTISIFKKGDYKIKNNIKVPKSRRVGPPKDLLIVSPKKEGSYPILLFIHGTMMPNDFYSDFFEHVASHGFIVVAPQIYLQWVPSQSEEIEDVVSVANWLPSNLDNHLPNQVTGDLTKLTISGHSRGGKTAFALALGVHQTNLNVPISALVAIDPVAGANKYARTKPRLLTYTPDSFNLSIPVTVIGTGLGNKTILGKSCAPNKVNHVEFYNECKSATHFVLADYGHNDLLDGDIWWRNVPYGWLAKGMCANGDGEGGLMRTTLGGIVVGFIDYAFNLPGADQFIAVLNHPALAPAKLYPVDSKGIISMVQKL